MTSPAATQPIRTEELRRLSASQLRDVYESGTPFDPERLVDSEYVGVSLGLPRLVERLSWTTFMKVFHRDGDVLRGWNVRLEQTGIDGAVEPQTRSGDVKSFGHFVVRELDDDERAEHGPADLLLDYTAYSQPPPLVFLRDPLVSLDGGVGDRLLGFSYAAVGSRTISTPSYFVLQRHGELALPIPRAPRLR